MNFKNYTLQISYINNGLLQEDSIVSLDLKKGFKNDIFEVIDLGDNNSIKLAIKAYKPLSIKQADVIYDHFYGNKEQFYVNGFQSWTTSKEYKKGDTQYGLRGPSNLPIVKDFAAATGDYFFTMYGKDLFHSFTYTYFRNDDKVELVGSLNEKTGYTIFYADMKENVFVISKDIEGLTIDGDYELLNVIRFVGSYDEVFDNYFNAYPLKHTKRVEYFSGYTSWYNYYQNIDEKTILRDLEGIKKAEGYTNIFQIDDGYETKVGDWDIDANKFPNGLKPIVDKIHSQNLKAGLWICPFGAEFKANIVKNHPDWLIKNEKGKPIIAGFAWNGFYALDIEKEEVKDYIRAYFKKVFDWGFDMVKLDFLYATAMQPRNGKTRGQLMCEGMEFLREICGDKMILGCGVPLGPAFGYVDACRISCDAEISFKEKFYTKVTNQEIISSKMAMNNSIFRRHLDGRIFANDPDVFFLRDDGFKIAQYTLEQKKLLAKVNKMFGSVLFVSDNIGNYDAQKMEILKETYTRFDGKVISAEYVGQDVINIVYKKGEKKYSFTLNLVTGENKEVEL